MSSILLKERINERINSLDDDKLSVVYDFLQTLDEDANDDPTEEILADEDWANSLRKSMAQAKAGQTVRWEDVDVI